MAEVQGDGAGLVCAPFGVAEVEAGGGLMLELAPIFSLMGPYRWQLVTEPRDADISIRSLKIGNIELLSSVPIDGERLSSRPREVHARGLWRRAKPSEPPEAAELLEIAGPPCTIASRATVEVVNRGVTRVRVYACLFAFPLSLARDNEWRGRMAARAADRAATLELLIERRELDDSEEWGAWQTPTDESP